MVKIELKAAVIIAATTLLLSGCFGGDANNVTDVPTNGTQTTPPSSAAPELFDPEIPLEIIDDGGFTWDNYRDTSPTFLDGLNPDILKVPDIYYTSDHYSKEEIDLLPRHLLYLHDRLLESSRSFETGDKPETGADLLSQNLRDIFTQEGIDQFVKDYNSEPFNYKVISLIPGLIRVDTNAVDQKPDKNVPWKYSYENIKIGYDPTGVVTGYDQTLTIPVSVTIKVTIIAEDGSQAEYAIPSNWKMYYEPNYGWQIYSYSL